MSEIEPGTVLNGRWILGDVVGLAPDPDKPCDAPDGGGAYMTGDGTIRCRCIGCPRCGHHTGNSNQGHYWAVCKVLSARLRDELAVSGQTLSLKEYMRRTRREFHLCCPDPEFGCSLEAGK